MRPGFLSSQILDVGWPYVISGSLLVGVTLLIPALDDVQEARWQRDAARAVEQRSLQRLENYARYLDALERRDPDLIRALMATQLRQVPAGEVALTPPPPAETDAVVFADLEPDPVALPPRRRAGSILERWTTSGQIRPWLLALGSLCLLVGLLPPAAPGKP
ncbi:MAG: hypothetical protein ACF8R7_03645 [Phycisphaerales bacterium JB039]